jgi:hypothetical protein
MSTIGRAPKDYNAGAWGRVLSRIDKAIALISNRMSESEKESRQLQATQREQRATLTSMLTPEATFEWSEYVDPSTEIVYAQCIVEVTRGWAIISDFEYRSTYGNIGSTDSWLSYKTNPAMQFVVTTNYKGGGYYLYREQIGFIKSDQTFCVELRGKAANGDVWLQSSHTFDGNKVPQFRSEPKLVLQWYSATEKWQVRATGEADDDTLSVGFYISDNSQLNKTDVFVSGNFTTGVTNLSGNDKRFNVLLGSFTPSTKAAQRILYVAAGAFDGADASADNIDGVFESVLLSIEIPVSPTASGILEAGDITGEYLADSVKRASVNLIGSHTPSSESSSITVSGTIEYAGDASPYTIASQNISVGTNGTLHYIYFDPAQSASVLQSTTSKSTATSITGKRLFVGIAKGHTSERAFFVLADDQPVISAPYIYASKLQALSANMGTLQAGSAKIGDEVNGAENGIHINEHNYWYEDGDFSVGNGSNAITYDSVTGTLTVGVAAGITTYKQPAPAPSPVNAGDLWYNETDDNIQRYNGTGWDIIGSEVEDWRALADRTLINGGQIYTNTITATQIASNTITANEIAAGTITASEINVSDLFAETITLTGSISSNNYVAATSGWSIGASTAEFNDVTIRGTLTGATGSFSGQITATSGSITGTLTMGSSGKIEFTGGGQLSPRYLTSGTNTFHLTGQGIRVGETDGGEIFVDAQGGRVDIYSRDGNPIALSASGGVGADITLAATRDISLSASGSIILSSPAKVGTNAIWHAGNLAVGNGLSYASNTLRTESVYMSGIAVYGGDTGIAQIRLGDGTLVWVKCEDVT